MDRLLIAMRDHLRASLVGIRDGDVYITPHLDLIPKGCRPPCVGVKDGGTARVELAGGMERVTRTVLVVVYVQHPKPEANLVGDKAGVRGVLSWARELRAALADEPLGLPGFFGVFCPAEAASETVGDDKEMLQRVVLTFNYENEEDRP